MIQEDALGLSLYLQCLPMMYHPESDRGLKRAFTMISSSVADLVPLYGSFQGTRTPDVLLQNRRGELVFFSPFDSDMAPHMVVTGVSGAGKSFLMNFALSSAARRGAHVLILDKGNSYRNLCELLGGQYVVFDPNRPLRINPLGRAEDMDKDRLVVVKDLLSEMASQGEEPVRKEERTVLENSVLRAVAQKKSGEVFLSDVYRALLEEARTGPRSLAQDLDRLVLSLKPFVGNGAYSGFFDGPSEIDFTRSFTVFELGEIAKRREIASSLLMAIMTNAADFCGAPKNLSLRKYLVIDEAWSLLQSPATARFIEEALRTFRKYNAAAVMVTQQVSSLLRRRTDIHPGRLLCRRT
jgi:conjugal transfer ATP-binding protein TraC